MNHDAAAQEGVDELIDFLRILRPALVGAVALAPAILGACADNASGGVSRLEAEEADRAWRSACPDMAADSDQTSERANAGDIEAIDCQILMLRSLELFADWNEGNGRYDDYPDYVPGEMGDHFRTDRLAHLYARWRLTGERWDELAALARTLPKADIESATYLSGFDDSLLPRRDIDACGRTAETDPAYQVIQIGAGDREPPTCDRAF